MKSVILCSLLFVSLAFSLYGIDDSEWDSGNPPAPKHAPRPAAPVDSIQAANPNSFTSQSEYDNNSINSRYSDASYYTSNTLEIPLGRFEAIIELDKYGYEYKAWGWGDYLLLTDRFTTFEMMCKYRLRKDWKIGLAAILKEDYTPKITYNHYLKLELSKESEEENAKFGFKVYAEESLEKGYFFNVGYAEPGFYPPSKDLNQSKHHWGTEFYYCLANPVNLVSVETNYPLTFARPQSFYIAGGFDYTYCYYSYWSEHDEDYLYASEGWLAVNYKLIKQVEFTLRGMLNERNIALAHSSIGDYTTWIDIKPGITGYLVKYRGASLMANASYLHQYYHRDWGPKETYNPGSIVPALILIYKYNSHLLLNSMLSRQYYTGDPDDDIYGTLDRTWDFKLGMTVEF